MSLKMWKGKSNDYRMIDRNIAEQYNIGGVDMFLYTYQGTTGNVGSADATLPDSSTTSGLLSSIGDTVFGETVNRKYNTEAIILPVVYQIQEATPDYKLPGLFFNYNTMDITVHYNMMMQRIGRKIVSGDVLELPNLRDTDLTGSNAAINKWYVVQDSFKSSEGYSQTWLSHIFKLRVKPLTDSPEYADIVDKLKEGYINDPSDPNNTNPDNTGGAISTGDAQNDIINTIIQQANAEVPYMHWDNEHIYDDTTDLYYSIDNILTGFEFPVKYQKGTYFNKKYVPVLYEKSGADYVVIDSGYGDSLPKTPKDSDFFFVESDGSSTSWELYQFDGKWYLCTLPSTEDSTIPEGTDDYYYSFQKPQLFLYDGTEWVEASEPTLTRPFTSKDIAANRTIHDDVRGGVPPIRGTVGEGSQFPDNATDGEYFYRTDFTPATVWQYSASQSKWSLFPYGGRLPAVGADNAATSYVNSKNRISIHDVVKPNIKQ